MARPPSQRPLLSVKNRRVGLPAGRTGSRFPCPWKERSPMERTSGEQRSVERRVRTSGLLLAWACAALGASAGAQKAYVTNATSGDVTVIDTLTNTVRSTIPVGLS